MKVTLSWLKDFIDLQVTDPQQLASKLTHAGIQVASAKPLSQIPDSVVVARILARTQHPNADRLSLCKVEDGTQSYDIVCGATNMKAGDKVALARVGSKLPGDFEIKKSKIRGETSEGMLCSARELQLGQESDGIMILDAQAKLGEPVVQLLGLNDALLEIEITPNRGDCLCVAGLARELAALGCGALKIDSLRQQLQQTYKATLFTAVEKGQHAGEFADKLSAQVAAPQLCPRYMLQRLELPKLDKLPASPPWLLRRLEAAGLRAINCVVDITNYVMLEYGQPLHAFDFDKVTDAKIIVRNAKAGEKLRALNEQEYTFNGEELLICDAQQPLCIAGVMGGADSGVTEGSRRLLIEAAYFIPGSVRATARRLALSSDSSYRFERHVDPQATPYALARAVQLLQQIIPGTRLGAGVDIKQALPIAKPVRYRSSRFTKLMGYELDAVTEQASFAALGFQLVQRAADEILMQPPAWRGDIAYEEDLIEELARLTGYDRLQVTLPVTPPDSHMERRYDAATPALRAYLSAHGFHEAKNLSFLSAAETQVFPIQPLRLSNPLSEETGYLRPALLPSLLRNLRHNVSHFRRYRGAKLYEINHVFLPGAIEETHLAALAWQEQASTWRGQESPTDFHWLKGILQGISESILKTKIYLAHDSSNSLPFLHPGVKANLMVENKPVGWIGQVHPEHLPADLLRPVVAFEFNWEQLAKQRQSAVRYKHFSHFPAVYRDMALLLDGQQEAGELLAVLQKSGKPLLQGVELIDLYCGERIPAGKQSLAFRLWYQAADRTLTDQEVEGAMQTALSELQKRFNATLRN